MIEDTKQYLSHSFDDCLDRISECEGQVDMVKSIKIQLEILDIMEKLDINLPFRTTQEERVELKALLLGEG